MPKKVDWALLLAACFESPESLLPEDAPDFERCARCGHFRNRQPEDGHCYMFAEIPAFRCAQFRPVAEEESKCST